MEIYEESKKPALSNFLSQAHSILIFRMIIAFWLAKSLTGLHLILLNTCSFDPSGCKYPKKLFFLCEFADQSSSLGEVFLEKKPVAFELDTFKGNMSSDVDLKSHFTHYSVLPLGNSCTIGSCTQFKLHDLYICKHASLIQTLQFKECIQNILHVHLKKEYVKVKEIHFSFHSWFCENYAVGFLSYHLAI